MMDIRGAAGILRPSLGTIRSDVVTPNRVLFLIPVLILVFSGKGRFAIGFLLPHTFGIRLAVLRHIRVSLSFGIGPQSLLFDVVVLVGAFVFQHFLPGNGRDCF